MEMGLCDGEQEQKKQKKQQKKMIHRQVMWNCGRND